MLSRVADSLYWMSRYLERAEHTTRLLDVNLSLMLDDAPESMARRWLRVLQCLGVERKKLWVGDPFRLAHRLTFDEASRSSVLGCVIAARENARHVREQISTEMWQRLNSLYLQVTRPEMQNVVSTAADLSEGTTEFLSHVMEALHQFQGVTDSTMSHGEGWQFIQIGRYLERATATARLLESYHDDLAREHADAQDGSEYLEWMGVLRSATAFEAYCKVYTADFTPEWILEFLLFDADFPHSLRFSIDALRTSLDRVREISGGNRAEKLTRLSGRLRASIGYSSVEEVASTGVVRYLRNVQHECALLHAGIYELYIDYTVQTALAI